LTKGRAATRMLFQVFALCVCVRVYILTSVGGHTCIHLWGDLHPYIHRCIYVTASARAFSSMRADARYARHTCVNTHTHTQNRRAYSAVVYVLHMRAHARHACVNFAHSAAIAPPRRFKRLCPCPAAMIAPRRLECLFLCSAVTIAADLSSSLIFMQPFVVM
jgi:hypothetical protein